VDDAVCYRQCPEAERTHECCLHAERNALLHSSPIERRGGTMYVTGVPCKTCALHIMASGLSRLVYLEYSHSDSGRRVSDDAFWEAYGVPVERVAYSDEAWAALYGEAAA
jgi:deoxycytidylate deaminase